MTERMNLEEKLFEVATMVATCAATSEATSRALAAHEAVCANRYGWVLKIVVGSAGATLAALLTLSFLLLDKIL